MLRSNDDLEENLIDARDLNEKNENRNGFAQAVGKTAVTLFVIDGVLSIVESDLAIHSYCHQNALDSAYQGRADATRGNFNPPAESSSEFGLQGLLTAAGTVATSLSVLPLSYGFYRLGKAETLSDYCRSAGWITAGMFVLAGHYVCNNYAYQFNSDCNKNQSYQEGYNEQLAHNTTALGQEPSQLYNQISSGLKKANAITSGFIPLSAAAMAFFAGRKAKAKKAQENLPVDEISVQRMEV